MGVPVHHPGRMVDDMTPAERKSALELEFVRLKQRADWIDRQLQGHPGAWAHIIEVLPQHIGVVELDKVIAEGRATSLAMSSIAKTLSQLGGEEVQVSQEDPIERMQRQKEEDELATRRDAKSAGML